MVKLTASIVAFAALCAQQCLPAFAAPNPLYLSTTEDIFTDELQRRYLTTLNGPNGYRFSWGIDGYRVSYGTSTGQYISRSTITGSSSVGQNEVNKCGAICEKTSNCGFLHLIQMNGGTEGNVICALYTTKQSKSAATYNTGTSTSGGKVVYSYGFTRNAGSVTLTSSTSTSSTRTSTTTSSKATTTTASSTRTSTTSSTTTTFKSTTTTSTSTTSKSSTTSTSASSTTTSSSSSSLPAPPAGATLTQFQGCTSSSATVPMFVNKNYPITGTSSASTVWLVQHGSSRNFDDYFTSVYNVVGDAGVIIAPNFYATSDSGEWYQAGKNLAWNSNDWSLGADAVSPSGVSSCSSFDVYDNLISSIRNSGKFPNVNNIFMVAHSAGASMFGRYGMLTPNSGLRYVLANAPAMPYFTSARPNSTSGCGNYNDWGYGWASSLPRYVAAKSPGGTQAFKNWITQDITLMTGDYDTYSRDQSGDQSCPVQAQGGQNRRDRGYAFWAYINLLGGTSTDVSNFYGYSGLVQAGVTSLNPSSFRARYCVVDQVAHDNNAMFASDCGRAAINGASSIPYGPGPIRPA